MSTTEISNVTRAIDTYFAFLNETDATTLRRLANEAWTEDARYVDPHHDGTGREVLVSMVEEVHANYAGFSFNRTTGIDAFGSQARYGWSFNAPDGSVVLTGEDYASLAADGRIQQVTGFHGDLRAL
jgi:hypothetical protein